MRVLASDERSLLRHKVIDGLRKLGVDGTTPVLLAAGSRDYLASQIVDALHALGRSAEVTPATLEREARWMTDELRDAGVTFAPYPLPIPDPYRWALAELRGEPSLHTPCGCTEVTRYTPPDPYARHLSKMKKEHR